MTTVINEPDPEVRSLIAALDLPSEELAIDELRASCDAWLAEMNARGPADTVGLISDTFVEGPGGRVRLRTYEPPTGVAHRGGSIVFVHGGGWACGNIETADGAARALTAGTGVRVVSVDYRLAPESPFPAAFDDCVAVVEAVVASGEAVVVAGESAGGNLAAAVALHCRDAGIPLKGQVLINPLLNHASNTPSYERFASGFGLTTYDVKRYLRLYAGEHDPTDPRLAPLNAQSLRGVAPAIITTAGFDPLLDDGVRYTERLIGDDVPVVYLPMPTMLHGWLAVINASSAARRELARLIAATGALLAF